MDYWGRRDLKEQLRLYDDTDYYLSKKLAAQYRRLQKEVQELLAKLIADMGPQPTANELYKQDKFNKLLNELEYKLTHLGQFEKDLMFKSFSNFYASNYDLMGGELTIPADDGKIVKAIESVWAGDGMNFSDRIWKHKRQMIETLRNGLIDTVATGKNWAVLSNQIQKDFQVAYYQSKRLVRTELSHIQNESTLQKYRDENVEEVRYVAERDNKTCPDCSKHNGKAFYIERAPRIPLHPNCRCTYIPVIKP